MSATVKVLERLTRVPAFGVRYWDPVLSRRVTDGLVVSATSLTGHGRTVQARRTPSGVYAFRGLPGLAAYEHDTRDAVASPAEARPFAISAMDTLQRYAPVSFQVDLPMAGRGVYPGPLDGSPDAASPPGVLLYSAASRRAPSWFAVVRGSLRRHVDGQAAAAAHAVVVVEDPQGRRWPGIADREGRFAVLLAYPAPERAGHGSPPGISPLSAQSWEVALTVQHDPGLPELVDGRPDYAEILNQPLAAVWQENPATGLPVAQWVGELQYGAELTARSAGQSELWVAGIGSP